MKRFAVLMLVCLLLFSACGGDDDDGDSAATDPTATPTEAIATSESVATTETATEDPSPTDTEQGTEPATQSATETQAAEIAAETETEAPATGQASGQIAIEGATTTFDSGHTASFYSVQRPVTDDLWTTDLPTNEFMAIEVEECTGPNAPSGTIVSVGPLDFVLLMADGTWIEPTIGVKQPVFDGTDLTPGECLRGWITYEVPQGQQFTDVDYQGFDYTLLEVRARWPMPTGE